MIVHDLSTPLAGVVATLEMLRDGDFGPVVPAQVEAIRAAERRAEDLTALIEDLRALAHLDEPRLPAAFEPVVASALLAQVVAAWEIPCRRAGAALAVGEAADVPLRADPHLLRRALDNLVKNALDHAGARRIALSVARDADGVRFSVTDDGAGIGDDEREAIFRPFVRGAEARGSGSGLGLAFCRQVAAAHGGRTWVTAPAAGSGSAFHVWVPAEPVSATG